jgi:hypothetical protein
VVIHMAHQEWAVWITSTNLTENKKVPPRRDFLVKETTYCS